MLSDEYHLFPCLYVIALRGFLKLFYKYALHKAHRCSLELGTFPIQLGKVLLLLPPTKIFSVK